MLLSHAGKERHRRSLRSAEEMQPGIRRSLTLNRRTLGALISTGKGRRCFPLAVSSLLYSKRCQCFLPRTWCIVAITVSQAVKRRSIKREALGWDGTGKGKGPRDQTFSWEWPYIKPDLHWIALQSSVTRERIRPEFLPVWFRKQQNSKKKRRRN